MAEYFTVTVDAKGLHIEDSVQLLDGRSKQDFMISDGTQYVKLTLWEAEVGKLKKYQCYRLSNILICEFKAPVLRDVARGCLWCSSTPFAVQNIKLHEGEACCTR